MGPDRHRWTTQRQVGVIIACSLGLTIFYSYLDLGPRDTFRVDQLSYHVPNNFSYYLVDGAHCKIPNLDPHHWSVRKFVESRSYVSCRNSLPHVVLLRRPPNATEVRLEVDKRAAKRYFRGGVTCCYQVVTRLPDSDDKIKKDKEVCFKTSTVLPNSTQMATVNCAKYFKTVKFRRKGNIVYENMFYIIVLTESVREKMKRQDKRRRERNTYGENEELSNNIDTVKGRNRAVKTVPSEDAVHEEDAIDQRFDRVENRLEEKRNRLPDSNDLEENTVDELKRRDFKDKLRKNVESFHKKDELEFKLKNNTVKSKENKYKLKEMAVNIDKSKYHFKEIINEPQGKELQEDDLSLLIIGIDSISRLNLMRAMPLTRRFLDQQGWFELEGYNKVADNTLPNLLPLLSGRSKEEMEDLCNPNSDGFFDPCPILWRDLSARDYITSYAEDLSHISTFNYHKKGFKAQPTDYYWRPLLLAGEAMFKRKSADDISRYCVGSSIEAENIMDYTHEFVNRFHNYSYFSFVWMNAFSHNDVNAPSRMDKKVSQFLSGLNYTALNNTAILFLSDHGIRFGPIRTTFSGWFEERLPYIFFRLPDWYQKKYPEKIANLRANKNRLTNPYDVYETLNELMGLRNTSACEKCSSLLQPIDVNRACSDIRISEHWCTCNEIVNLHPDDPRGPDLARVILEHIDALLSSHRGSVETGFRCANLTLKKLHSLQTNKNPLKTDSTEMFVVQIETAPSGALFEATVVTRPHESQVTGDVSRLNMYRDEGACLKDTALSLFCYCERL